MVVLILCAVAESAIGIIVGCLTIVPKFFQHASVKLSKALLFASKSTIKKGQESKGISNAPRAKALTNIKRSFPKYKAGLDVTESWSDLHHSRVEYHREYLTLTEFDASSRQATVSVLPRSLDGGTATRRTYKLSHAHDRPEGSRRRHACGCHACFQRDFSNAYLTMYIDASVSGRLKNPWMAMDTRDLFTEHVGNVHSEPATKRPSIHSTTFSTWC